MPLVSALGRQRQVDLPELEASQFYKVSLRTGPKDAEKPYLEKNQRLKKNIIFLSYPAYVVAPPPLFSCAGDQNPGFQVLLDTHSATEYTSRPLHYFPMLKHIRP